MAAVILAAGGFLWRANGRGRVEAASVAVLPFVDLSPERSNAYLGDGMAETLINALTNVEGLSVAARTSAFSFRDAARDVRRIGRDLGVSTVLEGSVQRAGDRLRVTAQLIKTSDGLHLWSENFDRDTKDIFAVQDEVARAVVAALKGKLVAGAGPAAGGGTENPAAYDAYLLGRFYWNKRTPDDLVRAAGYFSQAIRADSSYARAWSGLADAYVLSIPGEYGVPGINPDSILSLAERAARNAIALAPGLGEAHASLGQILQYRLKWVESQEAFERGIALSPDYATGHQWYSYHLMMRNRWDEAIVEMERAKQLDPLSLIIIVSLGFAYDGAERSAEAEAQFNQARAIAPDHLLTSSFGFIHELLSANYTQAAADYRAYLMATGGDSSHAAKMERRIRDPALRTEALREAAGTWVNFAVAIHRVLDGEGAVLAYLEKLLDDPRRKEMYSPNMHSILGPRLRADPRIRAVLVRMGYPQQ
jgi:TolB-like protein/Tfp pilus assembly protein PilF